MKRYQKSKKMLKAYLLILKEFTTGGLGLASVLQKMPRKTLMRWMIKASRVADMLGADYYDFVEAQFRVLMGWKKRVIPMPWHLTDEEKASKRYVMFLAEKDKIRKRLSRDKVRLIRHLRNAGFSEEEIKERYRDLL